MESVFPKTYGIFNVALEYARAASEFFMLDTSGIPKNEYKSIFEYAIFSLYGVPTSESSMLVWEYGDLLKKWLIKTEGTPENISRIDYKSRMKLAIISVGYFEKFCESVFGIGRERVVVENGESGTACK